MRERADALVEFRTQTAAEGRHIALHQGTFWGLVCGGAWSLELILANLDLVGSRITFLVLYYGSTQVAFLLPGLAGIMAACRAKRISRGIEAGLLCGMFGALTIFLTYIALSSLLLQAGQHDPGTIREFQQSGLVDMPTFIVGDYLAAMVAHLWIGLGTGLALGAVGAVIGAEARKTP